MNFDDLGLIKAIPGVAGALASMIWIKDTWPRTLSMFFAGVALSYFGYPDLSNRMNLNPSLAGFLLGLFGMSIAAGVFAGWQKVDTGGIVRDALRQLFRLPPKE